MLPFLVKELDLLSNCDKYSSSLARVIFGIADTIPAGKSL